MDDTKSSDAAAALEDQQQPTTHPDGSPVYSGGARRGDYARRRRFRPLPGAKR